MGQDIHGWVEIAWNPPDDWAGVIDIGMIVDRSRRLWNWLLQDTGAFPSVAPARGVPPNASWQVKHDLEEEARFIESGDVHSFTWITWAEIEAIDWDVGLRPGRRPPEVHVFEGLTEADGSRSSRSSVQLLHTRRDTLDGVRGWNLLFDLMRRLAQDYGSDRVRLVVWFDS